MTPTVEQGRAGRDLARRHALRMPLAVGVAVLAGLSLIYVVDPNEPGHYPLCPFRAATGWDCPGCGATRGLHDLLHGDVLGALDHNVLLAVAVPAAVVAWIAWLRRAWSGRTDRFTLPTPVVYLIIAVIVVFWVVRNLPGVPFLGSA